jgi:peptide/nickel transport system permease protein
VEYCEGQHSTSPAIDTAYSLAKAVKAPSLQRRSIRAFSRNAAAVIGMTVLSTLVLMAIFAPLIAPFDPIKQNLAQRLIAPAFAQSGSPFILGSDTLGRDVLSRLIFGARTTLFISFVTSMFASVFGVCIGLFAGSLGGRSSTVVMRLCDVQQAFPWIVIAIGVIAIVGQSFINLIGILALWTWVPYARVLCGEVLSLKENEYVVAARSVGARPLRILFRHILPNAFSPLIVLWTFNIAQVIIAESGLSFLGYGVQPPTPAWGSMVSEGRAYISTAWWLEVVPGLVIMLTVLCVNMVGDALRDALDPQLLT